MLHKKVFGFFLLTASCAAIFAMEGGEENERSFVLFDETGSSGENSPESSQVMQEEPGEESPYPFVIAELGLSSVDLGDNMEAGQELVVAPSGQKTLLDWLVKKGSNTVLDFIQAAPKWAHWSAPYAQAGMSGLAQKVESVSYAVWNAMPSREALEGARDTTQLTLGMYENAAKGYVISPLSRQVSDTFYRRVLPRANRTATEMRGLVNLAFGPEQLPPAETPLSANTEDWIVVSSSGSNDLPVKITFDSEFGIYKLKQRGSQDVNLDPAKLEELLSNFCMNAGLEHLMTNEVRESVREGKVRKWKKLMLSRNPRGQWFRLKAPKAETFVNERRVEELDNHDKQQPVHGAMPEELPPLEENAVAPENGANGQNDLENVRIAEQHENELDVQEPVRDPVEDQSHAEPVDMERIEEMNEAHNNDAAHRENQEEHPELNQGEHEFVQEEEPEEQGVDPEEDEPEQPHIEKDEQNNGQPSVQDQVEDQPRPEDQDHQGPPAGISWLTQRNAVIGTGIVCATAAAAKTAHLLLTSHPRRDSMILKNILAASQVNRLSPAQFEQFANRLRVVDVEQVAILRKYVRNQQLHELEASIETSILPALEQMHAQTGLQARVVSGIQADLRGLQATARSAQAWCMSRIEWVRSRMTGARATAQTAGNTLVS